MCSCYLLAKPHQDSAAKHTSLKHIIDSVLFGTHLRSECIDLSDPEKTSGMTSGQCNSWFENCGEVFGGWRLDVVSLLAVIGEAIVADQAQVISSSKLSLLPRLIPAPQAFLRAERPRKLPAVPGVVVKSILGGSQVNELNYFANVLHDIDKLPNYAVQECEISLRNAALPGKPTVAQKMWSPHNVLAVASCMITLGLFATACALGDGIAALAIAVLALQSSLGCAAWRWKPILMARVAGSSKEVPEGHVAIRTRGGGFVIIKCVEEVARLLYIGEDIAQYYLGPTQAKIATGVATAFLMVS